MTMFMHCSLLLINSTDETIALRVQFDSNVEEVDEVHSILRVSTMHCSNDHS
jgi:hypothetical protein